ncbi:(2Fe-2S)-binding protein [Aquincola sp. MAHUQ-54]|uniref:(2Fe-2S)-binding protein n=1 Tax=Aquincola agrisoli TaxID=3119538 RepID=A0AAW9Q0M3_9BURK
MDATDASFDLRFELNGEPVRVACPPDRRLLTLLREDFGLTGAKPGCEVGRCGACMVWLDGEPVNACLVMAWQLDGRQVRTIESVAADERSAPVREALACHGAVQCGYCNAGMVMTLTWLHGRTPRPDAQEAAALMCGNLCRCTGYGGVARAVEALF